MRDKTIAVLAAIAVLTLWEALTYVFNIPSLMLPSPTTIAKVFVGEGGQLILANTWPTAVQTVSGFAAAALLGVLVASAMVYSDVVRETIYPYLIAFQVIPKIALAPLFVLWLGNRLLVAFRICDIHEFLSDCHSADRGAEGYTAGGRANVRGVWRLESADLPIYPVPIRYRLPVRGAEDWSHDVNHRRRYRRVHYCRSRPRLFNTLGDVTIEHPVGHGLDRCALRTGPRHLWPRGARGTNG